MRIARLLPLAAAAMLAAASPAAHATFPGTNGKIAFVRSNDIYVMDANGTNVARLTSTPGVNEIEPTISPDGKKIAFTSDGADNNGFHIWVMGVDGSNPTQLTSGPDTDQNPSWSPDGTEIAFETGRTGLMTTIWVMSADGSNPHKVIDRYPTTNVSDPAWSPDGSKLAYVRDNPGPRIATASANDGSGEAVLTDGDTYAHYPSWAPDGSKIVYQHTDPYGGGGTDIYTVDVGNGATANLTSDAPVEESPAFSPDGTQIVYAANINGQLKLFRMDANGSNKVNLTSLSDDPSASDRNPDWGPAAAAPPTPTLSISDVSKAEGNSGTTSFDFTVSLSSASSSSVTVDYATADGTATAPSDYQAASGTLTFTTGQTSKTITVVVNGDTSVEPDETFTVNLSNASGAAIAGGTGTGTIVNDDSGSPPATACLTVSPSGTIDFGTGMLSKLGATVSLVGDQDVAVTNCGTAPETISVHGTDATAAGTTWNLVAGDPCAGGTNAFGVELSNAAGGLRVGTSDVTVETLAAGQSLTRRPKVLMACTGSDGAGKTLTMQLVFTATL